ncbi:hypothetical protein QQG74_09565 [Micromonospora sp. FIMYZ51]|uniref:hypothetical protein n=1 Tax=Micromonospora sp. FIMYZ51 TaxID=3051832 RepID=UPI00312032B9
MHEGVCLGGPLDGHPAVSRFPKGFLLVDKPAGVCWIYEWQPDRGVFTVRDEMPEPAYTEGPKNRYRAAEEANYDVLAAPWIGWQGVADGDAGQ